MIAMQHDVILADYCRFHIGGPADRFVIASSDAELLEALQYARDHNLRHFVYAGGSNLFFDDAGFRGLVIKLDDGGWRLAAAGPEVLVSAGYELGSLVRELGEQGYGGLEFLANIPGSVGGAVVGNAGCYGRCVADVLTGARVLDTESDSMKSVGPEYFGFDYRHTRLKGTARFVVLEAAFALTRRSPDEIAAEVEHELELRRGKHPHDAWCGGSYFKNPSRGQPAWQLITEAGMAAARVGGAALSERHANFLVNEGSATAAQVIELTHAIQRAVHDRHGVHLTPEVRYVSSSGVAELDYRKS
jgi:UDP-N-acetylmuramate dehydrogenase